MPHPPSYRPVSRSASGKTYKARPGMLDEGSHWKMPTYEETAQVVREKLGRTDFTFQAAYAAEQRALAKIRACLLTQSQLFKAKPR